MITPLSSFVPFLLLAAPLQVSQAPPGDLVQDAIQERSLAAVWQVGTPVPDLGGSWQAPNRALGMRTFFTPAGIVVTPREQAGWALALNLVALERGGAREELAPALLEVRGARAEYRRPGLLEWYENHSGGLHQAFEVEQRPLTASQGGLRLVLELRGELDAVATGPRSARFEARDGSGAVTWSGLEAWDAAGEPLETCIAIDSGRLLVEVQDQGAKYPITVDPVITTEMQKLVAGDPVQGATLGEAVAIDGNTFVAGATRDNSQGSFTGAAYVFHWNGTVWSQQAKLVGSDSGSGDSFGKSVAISGDRIVVGSSAEGAIGQLAGQIYVFHRVGSTWSEEAILQALDGQNMDVYGIAVAISGDTIAVGARGVDDGQPGMGAAYILVRLGGSWIQQVKLYAGDFQPGALFGNSIALDGGTLVVGAFFHATTVSYQGAVYVFVGAGQNWVQQAKLLASDPEPIDQFGNAVAVSQDTIVVGARFRDDFGTSSGAAYVFERSGGNWTEVAKLLASDGAAGDRFGHAVDIEGDSIVIGAPEQDQAAANAGAAYLFQRVNGQWVEILKFLASNAASGDGLGSGVGTSNNWSVAGSPGESSGPQGSGAIYVYQNAAGVPYCSGDGTATACPCGNTGGPNQGCANSTGQGAGLKSSGSSSVAADNLALLGSTLPPGVPSLLFVANNATNSGLGSVLGDGLRCAGGSVRRLGVRFPNAQGNATWGPGLAAAGGWSAGNIRRFQIWYRDPVGGPCGSGYNLSNGLEVVFIP